MISKTIIVAITALALTPVLAFAAPATSAVATKPMPTMSKQVKPEKVAVAKHHRHAVQTPKATKLPAKANKI